VDEVEKAQEVLAQEREAVLASLRAARETARRLAHERRTWKAEVQELVARGRAAGVRVNDMADALGVSRQWATQLLSSEVVVDRLRRGQGRRSRH
jgi:hypothetical protein